MTPPGPESVKPWVSRTAPRATRSGLRTTPTVWLSAGRSGKINTNNNRRQVGPLQAIAPGPVQAIVLMLTAFRASKFPRDASNPSNTAPRDRHSAKSTNATAPTQLLGGFRLRSSAVPHGSDSAPGDVGVARVGWRILGAIQSSGRPPETAECVAKRSRRLVPADDRCPSIAIVRCGLAGLLLLGECASCLPGTARPVGTAGSARIRKRSAQAGACESESERLTVYGEGHGSSNWPVALAARRQHVEPRNSSPILVSASVEDRVSDARASDGRISGWRASRRFAGESCVGIVPKTSYATRSRAVELS